LYIRAQTYILDYQEKHNKLIDNTSIYVKILSYFELIIACGACFSVAAYNFALMNTILRGINAINFTSIVLEC
jgi:hypothetical protein